MKKWEYELAAGKPAGVIKASASDFDRADALGIIIGNLVVLGIALWQQLPAACLVWPYWFQSVVIGIFHRPRILALQHFNTEGFTSNGRRVPVSEKGKHDTALFFALHYGFFHFMFGAFLLALAFPAAADWKWIGLGAATFATQLALAQRARLAADAQCDINLGAMLFLPYIRVLPIALGIGVVGYLHERPVALLAAFGLLKTGADVLMAWCESLLLHKGAATQPKA
jgi:hypothetical protein